MYSLSLARSLLVNFVSQSDTKMEKVFLVHYYIVVHLQDQVIRLPESEISLFTQFFTWAWSGSRYSGLLCMALSSTIYCIMEVLSDIFSGQYTIHLEVCCYNLLFCLHIIILISQLQKRMKQISAINCGTISQFRLQGLQDDVPLLALRLDKAGKHAVISLCIKVGVETEYDIIEQT